MAEDILRPSTQPTWNTDESNAVEPDAARKLDGWLLVGSVPEKPPVQYFNFWQNLVYKWNNWVGALTATQTSNRNILLNPTFNNPVNINGYVFGTSTAVGLELLDGWFASGGAATIAADGTITGTIEQTLSAPQLGSPQKVTVSSKDPIDFDVDSIAGTSPLTITPTTTGDILVKLSNGKLEDIQIERGEVVSPFEIDSLLIKQNKLGIPNIASTIEAQTGTDNTKTITPLRLFESLQGSNQSLASSGYQKLHGGLIIQWGLIATGANIFPIAFPNNQLSLGVAYGNVSASNVFGMHTRTLTGFSTSAGAGVTTYIAIGN